MPAAFGVLLITGLTVTQVIAPPAPNPIGVLVNVDPIDPVVDPPKPKDTQQTSNQADNQQTQESRITRPNSEIDISVNVSGPIGGLPPIGTGSDGGLGPVLVQGPPITPTFDPVSVSPRGNPGGWITDSDYRASWINRGYEGLAGFSLEVDARGRVNNCSITQSTGYAALDSATCRLLERRAQFEPARDSSGNAIASTYTNSVNWRIPE